MSKKRRERIIEPIANVGLAIEEAEVTFGKSIKEVQRVDNHIVGIDIKVQEGRLTRSATKHFDVDVLIGPKDTAGEFKSLDDFAKQVSMVKMHFTPFKFSKEGKISRGSLTLPPMWVGACTDCGAVVKANTLLKQSRKGKSVVCKRCGGKNTFKRKSTQKTAEASNPAVKALFNAYNAGYSNGSKLALPRAWALYREGQTPTEWVPAMDDNKALSLAIKADRNGMELRPAQHAIMSQSKATSSFVIERTSGLAVGWLSRKELTGGTVNLCGYKMQAGPVFNKRRLAL